MANWRKIYYKDGWCPDGSICILTEATASGRWAGEKYAIFGLDRIPHVAFWPIDPVILREESVSKEEAEKLVWTTINGEALEKDFQKTYS